jgi:hypothetical protein
MKAAFLGILAVVVVQGPMVSCSIVKSSGLAERERYFLTEVKPVLERNCLRCHNGTTLPGKLDLRSRDALRGGYIVPGQPDSSLFITAISRKGTHPRLMPQLPLSLTDDQIGVLREWIEDGATWPAGREGHLKAVHNPENP